MNEIKLDSLNIKPLPGQVLIETFDKNEKMQYGELELYTPVQEYDFGNPNEGTATSHIMKHSEKEGRIIAICDYIKNNRGDFDFEIEVECKEGDWVWFNAHAFQNSQKLTYKGRKLTLLDYRQLYMREEKMLNGYVLATREPRPQESEVIVSPFKEYYPNLFRIVKRGDPIKYTVEVYNDFEDMKEGDLVVTKMFDYPKLEEAGHRRLYEEEVVVLQTKEIYAKVDESISK